MNTFRITTVALTSLALISCNTQKWQEPVAKDGYSIVQQKGGPTLGFSSAKLIFANGYAFKDLDSDGELDRYEDWRLKPEERAEDLASKLSTEEIAGLMLYSNHQSVPAGYMGTYDGKEFSESTAAPYDLTDQQKVFLKEDNLRAVLITGVESPEVAARWNNNVQAYVEGFGHGIPANNSSDPRNQADSGMEFNAGGGGQISYWPSSLGMAATFDPETVLNFGRIASREYRALGITTALSPQVDLATEPRWWRFNGTFGESPELSADLAKAYCDGFQTSPDSLSVDGAWGYGSVNAMVKHWYGYGAQEAGRDSHFAHGEYAVYPGGQLELQKAPFTEGAFKLDGGTGMASAVMAIYSILWNQDPSGENVAGAYSKFVIEQQLRGQAGFEGVVCTDWGVTGDNTAMDPSGGGKPWGVEELSVAERHYRILQAGVDQFGGNNDAGPILEAYRMWVDDFGEEAARERFELSARRLLLNVFRAGLFENPYLDPEESEAIVGNPEYMAAGYEAQQKSIVMVKNHGSVLPAASTMKAYIPVRHYPAVKGIWGGVTPEKYACPVDEALAAKYFRQVPSAEEADFALVFIESPMMSLGYDPEEAAAGGNGYIPISLQYEDYVAEYAREESIAGGNPLEDFTNRTYKGKTAHTTNRDDMVLVRETRAAMGSKPVIVIIAADKPFIPAEIEPYADAILIGFGVQNQAVLDIVSGAVEPSGLLPLQLPADMKTVELQMEDVPFDLNCYTDSDGHCYDFAFGMNWSGVISDRRVEKYGR